MTDDQWEQVKELVHRALQLPVEQRAGFVEQACRLDAALRAEVESLLLVDARIDRGFLHSPLLESALSGALAAGDVFEDRFQLTRKLGEGGMGQVWLAEQITPVQRPVALKLIRTGMYDEALALRFQAERQSLAIMDHPYIAKVFEAGTTRQGQPYFVMEYVPGLPITEYCNQKKLGIRQRLELLIQACEGVQHAHQKAIIHRDLKPANILILEVDGKPTSRIIDFGLARPAAPKIADHGVSSLLGQLMGTPGYISPEQVDPGMRDIDTRTDVYSLGVVLYELLCGLLPFETKPRQRLSLEEWLRQLREEEPSRPSVKFTSAREATMETAAARGAEPKPLLKQLRGDLDWIAMKALDRDRERRYGTPSELAADLQRFLIDEAVTARPTSAAYRVGKFIRRNRVAALVAGTVTVLAIVASGAALIAVRKQHEAEYQTTQALQAQSRLLTQAAAQLLKDSDVAGAQDIILEVLTNPGFAQARTPTAISVFQGIRASDAQLAVLSGHGGWVYTAAASPDGARIVTASLDKTARIWDARTGTQLVVLSGHGGSVYSAAYSPDGARIATASSDRTARIWDARSGALLFALSGHDERVYSATYSPDGARIVTASADKTARIWDARTGAQLAVLSGHDDYVRSAAYSPDGRHVVTASFDKTARIWDALTGAPVAVLAGHEDRLYSAAYSPDGTRIVTSSGDKTARIWDARVGAQLVVLAGHRDPVYGAAYSPDGRRIVTASNDKTARIWDARAGTPLAVLSGHGGSLYSAAYIPGSAHIVTASLDKTARIWDAGAGPQLAILSGEGGWILSAAFSPDGTRVVTASADRSARIWDAQVGTPLATLSGHGGSVYFAAYAADGARIVTASNDKTARTWDAHTGSPLTVFSGHGERVYSADFSPDGTHVVTASADKTARIWDARSGVQLIELTGHGEAVRRAVYSPDGTKITTASDDMTARIWNARTGTQTAVLAGHTDRVYSADFSPDGTHVVTASADKTARIWDARTGAQLSVLAGSGDNIHFAAYSPDGKYVVTASEDRTARIWSALTGVQLAVLVGHDGYVNSAAYSPDGTRIVTASDDTTARLWDARVPAAIAEQIAWSASAETDPLSDVARAELGLPTDSRKRRFSTQGSACDQAAASIYDPDRLAPGGLQGDIILSIAYPACSREIREPAHAARLDYQMGRTLFAQGDAAGARLQFESAVAQGYRTAGVDLADLLVSKPAKMLDFDRPVSLYERAWRAGVPIAAFRLGQFYELVSPSAGVAKAWLWYQQGADAGEPNALARFAERDESAALAEAEPLKRNAQLLQAFTLYAAAAERARDEDWPDDVWRNWRYRRATLARVLAKEGLMQQVADAYTAVLGKWASVKP